MNRLILAIFLLANFAVVATALPVAKAYPGLDGALTEPNAEEKELLDFFTRERAAQRLKPFQWDGMISAVAREHSADMAEHDYSEYTSPRLGTMDYRLHRSGISGSSTRYAIFEAPSMDKLREMLRGDDVRLTTASHLGIGVATKGILPRRLYVTLIFIEKQAVIERFPTMPLVRRSYRLAGTLEEGLSNPRLSVVMPSGEIVDRTLEMNRQRGFQTVVSFPQRGRYAVELLADGELGPTIVELMRCYAGMTYPPPDKDEPEADLPKDMRLVEARMAQYINQARAQAHLPALKYDDRLAAVARAHSEDMLQNNFFAHVSPKNGNLADRMTRGGITARRFTENLAGNRSLLRAHQGLMESPAHRANIFDREVTHVGVGIVKGEDENLVITVNFIQVFQDFDTKTLAADFFKKVNAARKKQNVLPLHNSDQLARIAQSNSDAMKRNGKMGYDTARSLLEREKVDMAIQMAVLQSTDPAEPEQIVESLKANYSVVGIGIAQSSEPSGLKTLWTTVLLGSR